MNSFKEHLGSQGKSKSTITHYTSYLLDFISYLDQDGTDTSTGSVENITAKEVLSYLSRLQKKGQQNKTRNIRLNVIKQFIRWQVETGERADDPIAHLKIRGSDTRKLHKILSKEELEKIYHNYEVPSEEDERNNRNWFGKYRLSRARNKAILSLMIHQGLSTPEVGKLLINDLKLKEGKIYISGSRKSSERTLELRSDQIMELMEYQYTTRKELLNYQTDKEVEQLFLSVPSAGQEKASRTLQIWKGLSKEIREQQTQFTNFKQVRASVITHWIKQHDLRKVQYMAGHRYISSTERYLVNQTEDLQEQIDQFHPLG